MSLPPPGPKPTTMRIGLLGYAASPCACAGAWTAARPSVAAAPVAPSHAVSTSRVLRHACPPRPCGLSFPRTPSTSDKVRRVKSPSCHRRRRRHRRAHLRARPAAARHRGRGLRAGARAARDRRRRADRCQRHACTPCAGARARRSSLGGAAAGQGDPALEDAGAPGSCSTSASSRSERYGAPYIFIHRGDLHRVLAEAVRAREVRRDPSRRALRRRGAETPTPSPCCSRTAVRRSGRLLIGADGVHSAVRASVFGAGRPEFTGCMAWRGGHPGRAAAQRPHPDGRHQLAWDPAATSSTTRCGAARY